jgi:hypothetical protein
MANNYIQFSEEIVCATEEQAKWLVEQLSKETDDGGPSCEAKLEGKKHVWIHSEENANLEAMVDVLCEFQNCFKLREPITVSWAHTCSKPRIGEFGGGAVVVKDGKDHWIDAYSWARKKAESI